MGDMLKGRVAVITGAGNGIGKFGPADGPTIAIPIPKLQARIASHLAGRIEPDDNHQPVAGTACRAP